MADAGLASTQKTFLGHPVGLYTLFFTELWERFSFYGMKALLILYMLNEFLWTQEKASDVFAWYTGLVYATPVLGGIIADKWLGAKKSVLYGGILIAMGHLSLAFEGMAAFYGGLTLLVLGVGLLKPNVSTQVGLLYHPTDPRRDSAFTIFYMGINAGAFGGPLLCDWLRINYGWHYGFGAAAVGMFIGLIVYWIGQRWIIPIDQDIDLEADASQNTGPEKTSATHVPPHVQRDRVLALVIICTFAILFWVCFEQMANAMTVWADQNTNLKPFDLTPEPAVVEGDPGLPEGRPFAFSAGQLQSINPGYILLFGALFSWLWVWLDKRNKQPSSAAKMAIAVFLMAAAWGVMILGGMSENQSSKAPLTTLPAGIELHKYGATRLTYDASDQSLNMKGVLPDLDRLRLVSETSPGDLESVVKDLATKAEEAAKGKPDDAAWRVSETYPAGKTLPDISAELLPDHVTWDAATRTFATTKTLEQKDQLVIRAAAADGVFRDAVYSIFKQSTAYKMMVWWLFIHYMLATMGELCLSPVGLSLVTKLAPPKQVGLFMGLWFLTTGSIANFLAHKIGGMWGTMTPIDYFSIFAAVSVVATVVMVLLLRFLHKRMHGVH